MKHHSHEKPNHLLTWNLATRIAVVYPLGLSPKAPGTVGSLGGLAFAFILQKLSHLFPSFSLFIIIGGLLLLAGVSLWSIQETEKLWNTHDDGRIVIDEVLGQAIVSVFFPMDAFHLISAFALFRLFDISKPGLIGIADRQLPGAWGTLLDDVIAGIFALVLMALLSPLFGNVL